MGKRDTVFSGPNLFLNPLKVHEQILRNQSSAHKRAATKPPNRQPTHAVGKGNGHFFGAMQIDGLIDKDEFKKQSTTGFKFSAIPNPPRAPMAR